MIVDVDGDADDKHRLSRLCWYTSSAHVRDWRSRLQCRRRAAGGGARAGRVARARVRPLAQAASLAGARRSSPELRARHLEDEVTDLHDFEDDINASATTRVCAACGEERSRLDVADTV